MADDECQMADDECQMANDEGQISEPTTEASPGPILGHESNRVKDDSTKGKIGILSHESAHAAGQPDQGNGAGQRPLGSKIENLESKIEVVSQKAQNKAKLESEQSQELQEFKSEASGVERAEQSQFSQGQTNESPTSRDDQPARPSGQQPAVSCGEGNELLRAADIPSLRRSDELDDPGDGQMKGCTRRVALADLTRFIAFRPK